MPRVASVPHARQADVAAILAVVAITRARVPLMSATAECGFPSPADDYLDRPLDFNELLIDNAPATYAVRVSGDSMTGIGIFPGDIAVINRAKRAVDRSIVIAVVDGEFTLKRYRKRGSRAWLQAENPAYKDLEILEDMTFEVWGVVTRSIRIDL